MKENKLTCYAQRRVTSKHLRKRTCAEWMNEWTNKKAATPTAPVWVNGSHNSELKGKDLLSFFFIVPFMASFSTTFPDQTLWQLLNWNSSSSFEFPTVLGSPWCSQHLRCRHSPTWLCVLSQISILLLLPQFWTNNNVTKRWEDHAAVASNVCGTLTIEQNWWICTVFLRSLIHSQKPIFQWTDGSLALFVNPPRWD